MGGVTLKGSSDGWVGLDEAQVCVSGFEVTATGSGHSEGRCGSRRRAAGSRRRAVRVADRDWRAQGSIGWTRPGAVCLAEALRLCTSLAGRRAKRHSQIRHYDAAKWIVLPSVPCHAEGRSGSPFASVRRP